MRNRVYLDWNATTPLRAEARAAMLAAWDIVGNPSSVHDEGRAARRVVEDARGKVASALGADLRNVVFTSGGTEANALALAPGLRGNGGAPVERLIVSAVEHPSVRAGGRFSKDAVLTVSVDASGIVDTDALRSMLEGKPPTLVSVMLANNETGAIQPIAAIAQIVHDHGGLLHVDAVQALGKISININELNADILTVSAHKIGGPKGVGAVAFAAGVSGLEAAIRGGGQEQGRRAGTENVSAIAGFGASVDAAISGLDTNATLVKHLQKRVESGLKAIPGTVIFSADVPRIPNTTLCAIAGLKAETAVIAFDLEGIAISSGSACSSGKVQPSHVLAAMGVSPDLAAGALRFSTGWQTTEAEIDRCLEAWIKLSGVLVRV